VGINRYTEIIKKNTTYIRDIKNAAGI